MKKFTFTLQDAPDSIMEFEGDLEFDNEKSEYTVKEETAIALLINHFFPQLRQCNRRIKNLVVIDDDGNVYTTHDFDIYGSLKKIDNKQD